MDSHDFPLVSVVVPVYNHQDYIQECLMSILDQDYPHIELIVINDGSTDETESRVREIQDGAPRHFRYVCKDGPVFEASDVFDGAALQTEGAARESMTG